MLLSSHSFYPLLEWSQEASAHHSPHSFWATEEPLQSSLSTHAQSTSAFLWKSSHSVPDQSILFSLLL